MHWIEVICTSVICAEKLITEKILMKPASESTCSAVTKGYAFFTVNNRGQDRCGANDDIIITLQPRAPEATSGGGGSHLWKALYKFEPC
jgi:hypothetical protein